MVKAKAKKEISSLKPPKKRQLIAKALRDARDKTVLVEVATLKRHHLYQKRFTQIKKMLVQTDFEIKKGEEVVISETRPVSRRKAWKVLEVKKDFRGKA